jgi:hypothetical protein
MKYDKDEQQSEARVPQQLLLSPRVPFLPSKPDAVIASILVSSTSQVDVARKDAVARHSNPSTSHVSTTYALFTPSKTAFKDENLQPFIPSNEKLINADATPNSLAAPAPTSTGLFDRMKLQSRLQLDGKDTEHSDLSQRMTHTPSRLATFMDVNQGLASGSRKETSTLIERKLSILGVKHSDVKDVLKSETTAEMDPIQASELWQKARAEQRLLRTSQISENFEERWRNINAIRDSMFKGGPSRHRNSDLLDVQPKHVKDFSVHSSIATPRTRLDQRVSDQAFGDSEMRIGDLRHNFIPSSDYDKL